MDEGDGGRTPSALSRRTALAAAGASFAGLALAGAGVATGVLPGLRLTRSVAASRVGPATAGAVVRSERVYSGARGREVELLTILPAATRAAGLPVCVALHGRHGSAQAVAAGGLPSFLSATVTNGVSPPFAVVAVDGGDSYWHEHHRGDDPMGMLIYELPRWLAERGLQRQPFAAAGISMGGFGALHYARRRHQWARPLRAVAVIAPALITTWAEMRKRDAFHSPADWAAYDPLRHIDALGAVPIGLWCGSEDKFIAGARRFIATGRPQLSSIGPGGHDDRYFRTALPEAVRFLGRHTP
jgi:S-formylglutathione hydrolase FrmB